MKTVKTDKYKVYVSEIDTPGTTWGIIAVKVIESSKYVQIKILSNYMAVHFISLSRIKLVHREISRHYSQEVNLSVYFLDVVIK